MIPSSDLPALEAIFVRSLDEYHRHQPQEHNMYSTVQNFSKQVLENVQGQENFVVDGYCYVCQKQSGFRVGYEHSNVVNGLRIPNWREHLVCPSCQLNNRMRAALHIFLTECSSHADSRIYVTEQVTPLHKYLKKTFKLVTGSEYLGNDVPYGYVRGDGIRNESLTKLSFEDKTFDFILSFDVFEHIPNYRKAFSECYRILDRQGSMVFTVPFRKEAAENVIRAVVDDIGQVTHLKEPIYHGDPINPQGILCFQEFGWQMLDELREIGFNDVLAIIYGSPYYGYLGGGHIVFVAQKSCV